MTTAQPKLIQTQVAWLGAVPAHWTQMRLKDAVESCLNGTWGSEPNGDENDTPVIRVADFDRDGRRTFAHQTVRNVVEEQRKSRELMPGDLLIEKSGGGEQQFVGMVVQYTGTSGAVCSNFVARMRPRDGVDSRYLTYVHAHLYSRRVPTLSIKQSTGIQNLDSTAYLGEQLFLPPPSEQLAMARYLDTETARIDGLINEKQKLLGATRELRQASISQLVSGSHLRVRKLASGIRWLGEIPEGWRSAQLRHICDVVTDGAHVSPETTSPDYHFVSTVDIKDAQIDFDNCLRTSASSFDVMRRTGCCPLAGDVLFSKDGTIGRTTVVDGDRPFAVASSLVIIRPDPQVIDSQFLSHWLNHSALKQEFELLLAGAALRRISVEKVARLDIAFPDLKTQREIAKQIDAELQKADALITHISSEIALLQQLRSATITDAVLGRIDVRDHPKN